MSAVLCVEPICHRVIVRNFQRLRCLAHKGFTRTMTPEPHQYHCLCSPDAEYQDGAALVLRLKQRHEVHESAATRLDAILLAMHPCTSNCTWMGTCPIPSPDGSISALQTTRGVGVPGFHECPNMLCVRCRSNSSQGINKRRLECTARIVCIVISPSP
jgi:hypothetical protein